MAVDWLGRPFRPADSVWDVIVPRRARKRRGVYLTLVPGWLWRVRITARQHVPSCGQRISRQPDRAGELRRYAKGRALAVQAPAPPRPCVPLPLLFPAFRKSQPFDSAVLHLLTHSIFGARFLSPYLLKARRPPHCCSGGPAQNRVRAQPADTCPGASTAPLCEP